MFNHTSLLIYFIGLIFLASGVFMLIIRNHFHLSLLRYQPQKIKSFIFLMSIVIIIVGFFTIIAPLMTFCIGSDYWVIYSFFILVSLLLIVRSILT